MSILQQGLFLGVTVIDPDDKQSRHLLPYPSGERRDVSVTCIMPTRGRLFPARHAIECFRRQSHARRELVAVCTEAESEVEAYLRNLGDPRIAFHRLEGELSVGEMRNAAIARAQGDMICIWDDDDLSHPERIDNQLAVLLGLKVKACFLMRELLWAPGAGRMSISHVRLWENTMLAERAALPPYPALSRREDTMMVRALRKGASVALADRPALYCRTFHGSNVSGGDHFSRHFDRASANFTGADYERAVAELAAAIPISEWAEDYRATA